MKKRLHEDWFTATLFLSPAFLLILLFTCIPIVIAVHTSLYSTNYAKLVDFIGLENFKTILLSTEGWQKIFNSITYVLSSLILVLPLGIGAALLLNRELHMRTLMRLLIIIPWVLSQTVSALLWKWLLNPNFGPIVYLSMTLTGQQIDFFNTPMMARFTVTLTNVWNSFPIVLVITLAALQTIPNELYEAARVDGSTGRHAFWKLTLPLIMPTIVTVILMQSMEYFNMVTLIYVMTSGGPFGATETTSVKAFKEGFDYWHMGLGAAYSVIIFLMNVDFSIIYIRITKRQGKDD